MNTDHHNEDSLPSGERLIDAALSEHARLGRDGIDTELVHRILSETVNRPLRGVRPARASSDWTLWLSSSAAVAALVALAFLALSSFPGGKQERASDELQFVIRLLDPSPSEETQVPAAAPQLASKRYVGAMGIVSPSLPTQSEPTLSSGNVELVTTFGPTFETLPTAGTRREKFRITADQIRDSSDRRVYEGNVLVEHQTFRIEAGEVSAFAPGTEMIEGTAPLLASRVKVTQESPRRVAFAKSLRFDPISGSMVLSGVDSFETEAGKLGRFDPGDQLVLNSESFSVESPASVKYASPQNVTR